MSTTTRTVFLTGARGTTGRRVAAALAGRADVVLRAGSRTPEALPAGGAPFDWRDAGGWAPVLDGSDALYVVRPDEPDAPELVAALLRRAPQAHVVLLSEQGSGGLDPASWEARVEAAATGHPGGWTLVRPSWFQQVLSDERFHLAALRDEGLLALPSAARGIAWVDADDIAAVVTAALLDPPAHAGRAYTLTGPRAVPVAEVAALLAAAAGRPVVPADPPVAEAVSGWDPWLAAVVGTMFERVRAGVFEPVHDDVETVTGRPPKTLESFVAEHAALWRPVAAAA